MRHTGWITCFVFGFSLVGCASSSQLPSATLTDNSQITQISTTQSQDLTPTTAPSTPHVIVTPGVVVPTNVVIPSPTATTDPYAWESLPILPEISENAKKILQEGIASGNYAQRFSKVGDCESQASWFLGPYDQGPRYYSLGRFEEELTPVIEYYTGSFGRTSLAAKEGYTSASLLTPMWAQRNVCEKDETPLACEYRVYQPAAAFIMLGTNDASNPATFEEHYREVIEITLDAGVLPILGTKADNKEGDFSINATIARLADEYDVPLWNYWAAVQDLPNGGLQEDGIHLTFMAPYFDREENMQRAWPIRNLNALEILKRLMQATESLAE